MKRSDAMRPIIVNGTKAVKAVEDAISRSLKDGKAVQMLKDARAKRYVIKGKPKS